MYTSIKKEENIGKPNGLFYDLNHNLGLRLDKLLGVETGDDFRFKINNFPIRERTTQWFCQEVRLGRKNSTD